VRIQGISIAYKRQAEEMQAKKPVPLLEGFHPQGLSPAETDGG
jgi:hypothetical protein